MKYIFPLLAALLLANFATAQDQEEAEVVKKVDDLRFQWDAEAEKLQTYEGLGEFCANSIYRRKISSLLDEIHHYDTLLYGIVTTKFETNKDPEAKATIDDILTVEEKYTTRAFKLFLRQECSSYNDIERNSGNLENESYKSEVAALEEELGRYVVEVTKRIDIIDEHIHHLHLGE